MRGFDETQQNPQKVDFLQVSEKVSRFVSREVMIVSSNTLPLKTSDTRALNADTNLDTFSDTCSDTFVFKRVKKG